MGSTRAVSGVLDQIIASGSQTVRTQQVD